MCVCVCECVCMYTHTHTHIPCLHQSSGILRSQQIILFHYSNNTSDIHQSPNSALYNTYSAIPLSFIPLVSQYFPHHFVVTLM